MKKISLLILGIIIGAAATYLYCSNTIKSQDDVAIEKPHGVITEKEGRVLDMNWTKTRKAAVDSAAGKPDNRSSWWSLEDMQNYLKYAEHQSADLGYKMNGVRIYLGVYDDDASKEKAGYTTMFMVPTGYPSSSEASMMNLNLQTDKDIPGSDPLNEGNGGNPPSANYPQ